MEFAEGFHIENGVLIRYREGETCPDTVVIPDTVTTIGEGAFEDCACRRIVIPGSVLHLQTGAFRGCYDLKEAGWRFCCIRCDGPVIRLTIPEESGAPTDMVGDYFFFDDEFMILAEMILRRQTETCSEADRRLLLEDMKRMFNSYWVSLIRQ